jgi:Phosphoesterase family
MPPDDTPSLVTGFDRAVAYPIVSSTGQISTPVNTVVAHFGACPIGRAEDEIKSCQPRAFCGKTAEAAVVRPCLLFSAALFLTGCSRDGTPSPTKDLSFIDHIQHIVFLVKENRTFDNYFGTFPGADGATTGLISNGKSILLRPISDSGKVGLCNSWDCSILATNGGAMNNFALRRRKLTKYLIAKSRPTIECDEA